MNEYKLGFSLLRGLMCSGWGFVWHANVPIFSDYVATPAGFDGCFVVCLCHGGINLTILTILNLCGGVFGQYHITS